LTYPIDMVVFTAMSEPAAATPQRCPVCRTKIVEPDAEGWVVRNAILRVSGQTGHARAKCPRCKAWVEVPLRYSA
jgi:predicted Zn-ribbon and HTH transcriptional regulator